MEKIMGSRGDIEFAGGTRASLRSLYQSLTYEGLLDGAPTVEMNNHTVASMRERYRGSDRGHDALVLDPPQKRLEGGDPHLSSNRSLLPRVQCTARFSRWPTANELWRDESHLTLVWWQQRWALPIDEEVLAQLRDVRWTDVAYEWAD
jgi:hypothetical protein